MNSIKVKPQFFEQTQQDVVGLRKAGRKIWLHHGGLIMVHKSLPDAYVRSFITSSGDYNPEAFVIEGPVKLEDIYYDPSMFTLYEGPDRYMLLTCVPTTLLTGVGVWDHTRTGEHECLSLPLYFCTQN